MLATPNHQEIDHRTIKLIVGINALSLAPLTSLLAATPLTSISASFHEGGWSQSIFIGFLFAISAFLLAYNGLSRIEMVLSKVAAVAALGVALFPCRCDSHTELVRYVHSVSALVMFLVLTYFCFAFFKRAKAKGYAQAKTRAMMYALCGVIIVLSVAVLVLDQLLGGVVRAAVPRLVLYGEAAGLTAFGVSWLTASRVLPVLTRPDERFSPLRDTNPV